MEMTGEMMDSAIEDALDGDEAEEEADDVMAQARPPGLLLLGEELIWHAFVTRSAERAGWSPHEVLRRNKFLHPRYCPQVLEEIGIDVAAQMGAAPKQRVPAQQQQQQQQQEPDAADELVARLAALK
jgi:hypothetical protein